MMLCERMSSVGPRRSDAGLFSAAARLRDLAKGNLRAERSEGFYGVKRTSAIPRGFSRQSCGDLIRVLFDRGAYEWSAGTKGSTRWHVVRKAITLSSGPYFWHPYTVCSDLNKPITIVAGSVERLLIWSVVILTAMPRIFAPVGTKTRRLGLLLCGDFLRPVVILPY
jgi:hypothetical protein